MTDHKKKLQKMIDTIADKAKQRWFDKKFSEFGALADKNKYVKYSPKIIGADKYKSKDDKIKWEKMLEHQLYMNGYKMKRIDGRLKGFWLKKDC